MNKVEIKGTIYSFSISGYDVEVCLKNQDGFFMVIAVMSRESLSRLGYGVEVAVGGKLRGFEGQCYIVADVMEFI